MKLTKVDSTFALLGRVLLGTFILLAVLAACPRVSEAVQLIPSIGATKSMSDAPDNDAQFFGGLALRASVLPFLKAEGAIGYRHDQFMAGDLKVRQWPVTTSLWLAPIPVLYAGGGVGWYRTTFDYDETIPIEDFTNSQMGVHVGGGLDIPLSPKIGLDLNGRYIFMQGSDEELMPQEWDPDFWSTTAGLAIRF